MSAEENIKSELESKFGFLAGKVRIDRPRRIFADVECNNFRQVIEHMAKNMNFYFICAITGLDEGEKLSFIYHLINDHGVVFSLKTGVPKANPVMQTVTDIFPSAEYYEREVVDLFGAKLEGLPEGNRYPLTDDWPKDQFPLRKDWKTSSCEEGGVGL